MKQRRGKPSRGKKQREHKPGRVVATLGRRVVVADADGERVCFLAGQRAVVGDEVTWEVARGEGGKLTSVGERSRVLARVDMAGREQVLAANLGGIVVVGAVEPLFRAGLLDRYWVAAERAGLSVICVVNKADLGIPDEVKAELAVREPAGLRWVAVSAKEGAGLPELLEMLASGGPWAFVGHSGVGKTSLIAALAPELNVGPVGELSEYWGQGQHTTTGSRLFELPTGGEVVDSPGIRTFAPGGMDAHEARDLFPGVGRLGCRYRDCLHREGEEECVAPEEIEAGLLASYRRLILEILEREERDRRRR